MLVKLMIATAVMTLFLTGCNPAPATPSGASSDGPVGQMQSVEVSFKGTGDVEMLGTVLVPAQTPAPFVILFPGSGPTDRNGNQLPQIRTDLLKTIAGHLQKQGIGSFRFDKRVTPKTVKQAGVEMEDLPDWMSWANHRADAIAAYKFIQKRSDSIDDRIALIGHSEGGIQTLSIASDLDPRAVVLLSTPGRPLDAILHEQVVKALVRQDAPATVRDQYIADLDRLIKEIKEKGETKNVPDGLKTLFNPMTDKFLHDLFKEDPVALAGALKCPTLVMNGEKDIQISPVDDAPALLAALEKRPGGKQKMVIVPGVSHNYKPVNDVDKDTGFEGAVPASMLDDLAAWLKENL
jgi:pimeloyl-ACP methyl ester carboxylesterase